MSAIAVFALMVGSRTVSAHDGPPYPLLNDTPSGPYVISLWTDPDTTDDGTPGGQFWVVVRTPEGGPPPPATRAAVSITPRRAGGAPQAGAAEPVDGDVSRQFVVLLMDHEGTFDVRVDVVGPLGPSNLTTVVEATYDVRPSPAMLFLYLAPFVLVGGLWLKALLRRRRTA